MNKIDIETSKEIIKCYDKILELSGEEDRLSTTMDIFGLKVKEILQEEEYADRRIDKSIIEDIEQRVLVGVIMTVASLLCQTISYSAKSMQNLSENKEAVKKAVDEVLEKEVVENGNK